MILKNIHKFFVVVVIAVLLTPFLAMGATIKVAEELSVTEGNIHDNVYAAGGNVSINSIVFGDLLVVGGNVLISDDVSEDLLAVGGAITVLGESGGDMRVIGGNVLIADDVSGELVVVGGAITISSDVVVKKDLIVLGGQVVLDGIVNGDVQITGGVVTINGKVGGDISAEIKDKLTLGDGAVIGGNLDYSAKSDDLLQVNEGAVIRGETVFNEVEGVDVSGIRNFIFAAIGILALFKLAAFIVTALIFIWLFRKVSDSIVENSISNPLRMLGIGFISLVVIPIAAILLMATLFGVPLGIMTLLSYALLMFVATIYSGIVVGVWVSKKIRKSDKAIITWRNVVWGTLLLAIIKFIPLIGWIVGLFVFLITLGGIVDLIHKKVWSKR